MRPSNFAALCAAVTLLHSAAVPTPAAGELQNEMAQSKLGRRLLASAPEVLLGDRLFFETRFAQHFFAHRSMSVNGPPLSGDPIVEEVPRPHDRALPGPFRGRSISCRACHLGDDFAGTEPLAQRTYCDFSPRSPIPLRDDGKTQTVRNTPLMVDIGLARDVPRLFHFDGEFASAEDLVVETLIGREFGWKLDERATAIAHIASVIREDNGVQPRNVRTSEGQGIPYRVALLGADSSIPERLVIPAQYRLNVAVASDTEILEIVARLIHAYMDSIRFGSGSTFRTTKSPYDLFLEKNGLPASPVGAESIAEYARRLRRSIESRNEFAWVVAQRDGKFELHEQAYQFGELELAGLRTFLRDGSTSSEDAAVGNCLACHPPPDFTDHRFHNTGVSQHEYDSEFGASAFAGLEVPNLKQRTASPERYLPASPQYPRAMGRFRSPPSKQRPGFADLGLWNIFANPALPAPQAALTEILCTTPDLSPPACSAEGLLPRTVGLFKTPSIRDLGHSQPYLHSGSLESIEDVVRFYVKSSRLRREGLLRNGSRELISMKIDDADVAAVSAFLRSLNEDYH